MRSEVLKLSSQPGPVKIENIQGIRNSINQSVIRIKREFSLAVALRCPHYPDPRLLIARDRNSNGTCLGKTEGDLAPGIQTKTNC